MQTEHGRFNEKPNLPIVEIDDFEIDGLGFKPINKGLGFHGERELNSQKRIMPKRTKSFSQIRTTKAHLNHVESRLPLQESMSGIEKFYANSFNDKRVSEQTKELPKTNDQVDAELSSRLLAYILDCGVILLISTLIFSLFSLALYSATGKLFLKSFIIANIDFFFILNLVLYLIYFSMWDAVGTVGKTIFNLEVVSSDEKPISMTRLFNRSFLSLIGVGVLSIPNILDIHSSFSKTKTIIKE